MEKMERYIMKARDEAYQSYKEHNKSDHPWDKEIGAYWQGKFIAYCQTLALLEIYK